MNIFTAPQAETYKTFDIRAHLEALENLKIRGRSWQARCPVCGGNALKGATTSGKYKCWSGGCESRQIRERIAPWQGELSWQDQLDRERQRRERERQASEARAQRLDERARSGQYQALQTQLGLSSPHHAELVRRGLNRNAIERLGYKSLIPGRKVEGVSAALAGIDQRGNRLVGTRGILLWTRDPSGRILAAQIKTDSGSPKYLWWSSDKGGGQGPQLPNGELPLACQIPTSPLPGVVGLCEGVLKSAIAAEALSQIFIGASGGHFGLETLRSYLEQLRLTRPGFEQLRVVFYPDAGAVSNTGSIPANTYKLFRYLVAWGYEVCVGWWGQTHKTADLDIDELLVAGHGQEIQEITPQAFFELHPLAIRSQLEPFRPHRSGLRQVEFPVLAPHLPSADQRALDYQQGQRLAAWRAVSRHHPFVLDASGVGLGKSYDAGLVDPRLFDCQQAIYVTLDPRNVTTPTLQAWPVLQGRHGGLVSVSVEGTVQLRRAQQVADEQRVVSANCDRWQLAEILPARNQPATGDEICKNCPFRKSCRAGGGSINYLHQRRQVTVEPRYIAHPESLNPDDFPGRTLLIFDEASRHPWLRSFVVKLADIEHTYKNLKQEYPKQAALLAPLFEALYLALRSDLPLHGLEHNEVLARLPSRPELTAEQIEAISHQELEFLNLAPDGETELSDLPSSLRERFQPNAQELFTRAQQRIALRWLPEFWKALQGTGRLHLNPSGLQITVRNERLIGLMKHPKVGGSILLDATAPAQEFEAWLETPVARIRQATPAKVAPVRIKHVAGLGLLGSRRGNEQQRRSEAVLQAIRAQHPNEAVGVIDAKKFGRVGDGLWHRDSRGSNAHRNCTVLVLVGAPIANVSALADEYALLYRQHPHSGNTLRTYPLPAINLEVGGPWWVADLMESADPDLARFIRQRTLAEIEQAIGRLRGNCRPDEQLTVYWLSDYPLDQPVELLQAGELTPRARTRKELTQASVEQAIATLRERGEKPTQEAIAQIAHLTQGTVSKVLKTLAGARGKAWLDTIPSVLDLSNSSGNNLEPALESRLESAIEVFPTQPQLELARRLLQCQTRRAQDLLKQEVLDKHLDRAFDLLTPEQKALVDYIDKHDCKPRFAKTFERQEIVGLRNRPGQRGVVISFSSQADCYQVQVSSHGQEVLPPWDLLKVVTEPIPEPDSVLNIVLPESGSGDAKLVALCAALKQCEAFAQVQKLETRYGSRVVDQAIALLTSHDQEQLGERLALELRGKPNRDSNSLAHKKI